MDLQFCCKEGDTQSIKYAPSREDMPEIPDAKLVRAMICCLVVSVYLTIVPSICILLESIYPCNRNRCVWPTSRALYHAHPHHPLTFNACAQDRMQLAAVDHVLRHRVALVQGAPGTGKTLLGVVLARIIKASGKIGGPMLCVCYTNHALDQFLEDLSGHLSVVRCGGRAARNKVGVCRCKSCDHVLAQRY